MRRRTTSDGAHVHNVENISEYALCYRLNGSNIYVRGEEPHGAERSQRSLCVHLDTFCPLTNDLRRRRRRRIWQLRWKHVYVYILNIQEAGTYCECEIYVNVFRCPLSLLCIRDTCDVRTASARTLCASFSRNKIKQKMDIIEKENYKVVKVRLPILHSTPTQNLCTLRALVYNVIFLFSLRFSMLCRFDAAVLHRKRFEPSRKVEHTHTHAIYVLPGMRRLFFFFFSVLSYQCHII